MTLRLLVLLPCLLAIFVSPLHENTFDESSTHTSLTVGFTWRLGSAN